MKINYLIVGAGITGITIAERLSSRGKKVVLNDVRNTIGGNCHDYFDENENYIQKYGPHIFHTNEIRVWKYLSKFTKFNNYEHHVFVSIAGKKINIPFNLNSIDLAFSKKQSEEIKSILLNEFKLDEKIPILKLKENNNPLIKKLSDYIYKNVFLNYTLKQWGLKPNEIDPSVTARVPVYISKDNRYFQDKYQGIPVNGFSAMFRKMIKNKNIKIILGKDYKKIIKRQDFKKIYYTGPLDYFFNYKYGKILYRRISLKFQKYDKESFQMNSVINYPNNYKFTRKTEFNKFLFLKNNSTTVAKEYASWDKGFLAYPVQNDKNFNIIDKYIKETKKFKNVIFIGRLAECKYYNIDQAVKRVLEVTS